MTLSDFQMDQPGLTPGGGRAEVPFRPDQIRHPVNPVNPVKNPLRHSRPSREANTQSVVAAVPTARNPQYLNDHGIKLLICAVIEQAIVDYRILVKRKKIINGKLAPGLANGGWRKPEFGGRGASRYDPASIKALITFFEPDGLMDDWLIASGIPIDGDRIRASLSRPVAPVQTGPSCPSC